MRKLATVISALFLCAVFWPVSSPAQASPNYAFTLDCHDATSSLYRVIEAGTSLSITVNNCTTAVDGLSGQPDQSWSPANPSTLGTLTSSEVFDVVMVANANQWINFFDGQTAIDLYLQTGPLVASPPGDLLGTETVTISPNPGTFQVTNYGFTASNASHCDMVNGAHSYGTTPVTVTQSGTYTFRVTSTTAGTRDPVIGLYSSFDPITPEANLLACNDDGGYAGYLVSDPSTYVNALYSYVTVELVPGTYILMGSTYNQNDPVQGWTFTTDQTEGIQMWGPPLPPVEPAVLAQTGAKEHVILNTAVGFLVLGVAALLISITSRRKAQFF